MNTRVAFGSIILLPKNSQGQYKENLKTIYKIKNEEKKNFEDKRLVTKILKMDENNQYGNAMTNPFPVGPIKRVKKLSIMGEFDLIPQGISGNGKIGHLFIVILNSTIKMQQKNNYSLMKSLHRFLKKRKFCLPMKDRYFNFLTL